MDWCPKAKYQMGVALAWLIFDGYIFLLIFVFRMISYKTDLDLNSLKLDLNLIYLTQRDENHLWTHLCKLRSSMKVLPFS